MALRPFVIESLVIRLCRYIMPSHLSLEMRKNIVSWHLDLQKTGREIAVLAHCSEVSVWEVLRLYCAVFA